MRHRYIVFLFTFYCLTALGQIADPDVVAPEQEGGNTSCSVSPHQVINAGVGGNTTRDLLRRIDESVLSQHPDLVIVMVGTNDMLNSRKMLSYQDYESNLRAIVDTIQQSGAGVLLMSPPSADSTYLFQRHERSAFVDTPNEKLAKVSRIMKGLTKEEHLYFVDLFDAFVQEGLPQHNEDAFIRNVKNSGKGDGVHLTPKGYCFVGDVLFRYMKEKRLDKKCFKIICFGDSITKGVGGSGAGTISGENYPSFLYLHLNGKPLL